MDDKYNGQIQVLALDTGGRKRLFLEVPGVELDPNDYTTSQWHAEIDIRTIQDKLMAVIERASGVYRTQFSALGDAGFLGTLTFKDAPAGEKIVTGQRVQQPAGASSRGGR